MPKEDKSEDIKFDRNELLSDDRDTLTEAVEKRNKPLPEAFRDNPEEYKGDWPVHEGRLPAAMRADDKASLDYKLETYDKVGENARNLEADAGPGAFANARARSAQNNPKVDANKFQAPPTVAAQAAADGDGAASNPVPVVDGEGKQTNARPAAAKK